MIESDYKTLWRHGTKQGNCNFVSFHMIMLLTHNGGKCQYLVHPLATRYAGSLLGLGLTGRWIVTIGMDLTGCWINCNHRHGPHWALDCNHRHGPHLTVDCNHREDLPGLLQHGNQMQLVWRALGQCRCTVRLRMSHRCKCKQTCGHEHVGYTLGQRKN